MKNGNMTLFLFDIDSVLVHPGGYRAALVATVDHFSRALGFGETRLTTDEIESFEAAGITSEWDSAPICVAALALGRGRRPDFAALTQRLGTELRRAEFPAEAAHRLWASRLPSANGLNFHDILLHSRDIDRSPVMAVFQQFTLGPAFESAYGLPRTVESEAYLLKYDRPALGVPVPPRSAIYTARPSNPPRGTPSQTGYAPEAELGAELVGLGHLPIIGYGSMQWLAEQVGGHGEHFLKPSPVQGLAAIGAAAGLPEPEALFAAHTLAYGSGPHPLQALGGGRVIVFEDSAGSIRGVREAVALLGAGWECVGIGIAGGGPKLAALEKAADRIYASVDEAIEREIQ